MKNTTWISNIMRTGVASLVLVGSIAIGQGRVAPVSARPEPVAPEPMNASPRGPLQLFNCDMHDGAVCFREGQHIPCDDGNGSTGECFCQADLHYICV